MSVLEQLVALTNFAITLLAVATGVVLVYLVIERFLFARVEIADFAGPEKDEAVAGMSEIVRSELVRLTDEGSGASLFFVNGPDQPIKLPDEIKTIQLTWLVQLLAWLPGRITTVTGRLQPEGRLGLGVTIILKGGWNRQSSSVTIWERDLALPKPDAEPELRDTVERYQRLAIAAAAWTAYRLVANQSARVRSGLLTQDWLSYAQFLMATRLTQHKADADVIRPIYQAALGRDPRNRGALFGLGLLFINEHANAPAVRFFEACLAELIDVYPDLDERARDRLWYRANINAAIARLNELALRDGGPVALPPAPWDPGTALAAANVSTVPGAAFPATVPDYVLVRAARDRLATAARDADRTIAALVGNEPSVNHGRHAELVRFLVSAREYAVLNFQASV